MKILFKGNIKDKLTGNKIKGCDKCHSILKIYMKSDTYEVEALNHTMKYYTICPICGNRIWVIY